MKKAFLLVFLLFHISLLMAQSDYKYKVTKDPKELLSKTESLWQYILSEVKQIDDDNFEEKRIPIAKNYIKWRFNGNELSYNKLTSDEIEIIKGIRDRYIVQILEIYIFKGKEETFKKDDVARNLDSFTYAFLYGIPESVEIDALLEISEYGKAHSPEEALDNLELFLNLVWLPADPKDAFSENLIDLYAIIALIVKYEGEFTDQQKARYNDLSNKMEETGALPWSGLKTE